MLPVTLNGCGWWLAVGGVAWLPVAHWLLFGCHQYCCHVTKVHLCIIIMRALFKLTCCERAFGDVRKRGALAGLAACVLAVTYTSSAFLRVLAHSTNQVTKPTEGPCFFAVQA